jgi:hypothetical protein
MASPFACRDDDLCDGVDLLIGHRRERVNGRVDCLALMTSGMPIAECGTLPGISHHPFPED